jgi:hypothetical protein
MLPGFIAITLSIPFSYFLYVGLNYRGIFLSNIFSLISYMGILLVLIFTNSLDIVYVAYAKSVQGVLVFLFLISIVLYSYKRIKTFTYVKLLNERLINSNQDN